MIFNYYFSSFSLCRASEYCFPSMTEFFSGTVMLKNSPGNTGSTAAAMQLQKELKGLDYCCLLLRFNASFTFELLDMAHLSLLEITNDRLNDYCKVVLEGDNMFEWTVYIVGPPGTD